MLPFEVDRSSSISKADVLEKIGEFWDKHDFTDYDDPNTPDVDFKITCVVPVDPELLAMLEQARAPARRESRNVG